MRRSAAPDSFVRNLAEVFDWCATIRSVTTTARFAQCETYFSIRGVSCQRTTGLSSAEPYFAPLLLRRIRWVL